MKRTLLRHIFQLLVLLGPACSAQEDKDKAAIKKVIMLETESYFGVDQAAWFDAWLPVSYAYWSFSDSSSTQFIDGWDNIKKTFDTYFQSQKPSRSKINYTWQEIRVYGNGAYVRFRERGDDNHHVEETSQVRVLEKKDGKWKLVCMISVVD